MRRLACLALLLAGCAGPRVEDYAAAQPIFDPAQFFLGKTQAWGMFQDRQGRLAKRFSVEMDGRLQDGELVLDERFLYADGSRQRRVWRLRHGSDGLWHCLAGDVAGEARGAAAGNALHWRYQLRLPVDGNEYLVDMDDWMFLIDKRSMLNRASMSKLGLGLGEVTLFFRKPE
ncbi:DUF3833 domain-containing protein [Chromobacterium sphagni]|uniref:DUF3833 domain-containing protein n=1 Tax=Chromobacterium sphagni TaxID=1903179 RepID=A0ABX3CGT5_9NEIS|nr:DUF3833 domain-containing protein [Chromobacterium sphagni]OHX21338.1 hypothetical protein BI344_02045 [Chromobacterium sphagni]